MRILIKSYHYGNNAPPIVKAFKDMGHETKLICLQKYRFKQILKEHPISPLLTPKDIIVLNLSIFGEWFIRISRKLNLKIGEPFHIRKIKEKIESFNPDIIVHHGVDYNTYLTIKTNIKPQIGIWWSYGSFHQEQKQNKNNFFQYIFKHCDGFVAFYPMVKEFLLNEAKVPSSKIREIPIGTNRLNEFLSLDNQKEADSFRDLYGIPRDGFVIINTRSLRSHSEGASDLVRILANHSHKIPENTYFVLTKGILGKTDVVNSVQQEINDNHLSKRMIIVDRELSYDELLSHFRMADVHISMLKMDLLGITINESITQDCNLILTDLPEYRKAFNENAEYIDPNDLDSIINAINKMFYLTEEEKRTKIHNNKEWLIRLGDTIDNNRKNIEYYQEVISRYSKEPLN
ncbi:MAG: glycosyltransferase family 4 protein [Bacteroidetes bacterium]|nr:glycosyltransferase family 4 protein [Bacteroidota bacterium]